MVKWGTPTMGGLLVIVVVVGHLPRPALAAPGRRHRAARRRSRSWACWARRTTTSTRGPARGSASARSSSGRSVVALVAAYQIQNTYQITGIRVPFVGDVAIDPVVYIFFAAFAIVAVVQRRQHHRRPRRPRRRDARLRVRVVPDHRPAQRPGPAEPRPPVRADHRGAARLPVVQRPPGAGVHGRRRIALVRGDACRHRPDHRPDPGPADHRADLRARDDVGHHPDRLLQAVRRQARVPDGAAPPSLRTGWLGRGEDHAPLLDRRHPRRA